MSPAKTTTQLPQVVRTRPTAPRPGLDPPAQAWIARVAVPGLPAVATPLVKNFVDLDKRTTLSARADAGATPRGEMTHTAALLLAIAATTQSRA